MTQIPLYGQREIVSLAVASTPPPLVSIGHVKESFATLRLHKAYSNWTITTQPSGHGLRFGVGRFPYTGLKDGVVVTAFLDPSQDVAWNATYVDVFEAYIISPWDNPNVVWTVEDSTISDSPIIISSMRGSASQQFRAQLDGLD